MRMPLEDDGWQRVMKSIKLKSNKETNEQPDYEECLSCQ